MKAKSRKKLEYTVTRKWSKAAKGYGMRLAPWDDNTEAGYVVDPSHGLVHVQRNHGFMPATCRIVFVLDGTLHCFIVEPCPPPCRVERIVRSCIRAAATAVERP